ncbi:MAG: hypothetical protein E7419_06035 [Ruminococcaceae bacterium]|nr:hypothetical protein [Oscillospiraceae bacterium]
MKKKNISNKFRFGFNATIVTVLFIIAVLLCNAFVSVVLDKFPNLNIDLTQNKQFEISKESKDALKEIEDPVTMKLLVSGSTGEPVIEELLGRYKQVKNNIIIEKTDIEKNPASVSKYNNIIDPNGTLIIENKEKFEAVSFASLYGSNGDLASAESLITNGIISVTTGEKKTILFSEGHGEYPAYTIAAVAQKNYYNYDVLDITKEKIENCDMLVIFCPSVDFTSSEIADLESYVLSGGNLKIYLNPVGQYLPNLCEYIKEWGIEVKEELISEKHNDNIARQNLFIPVVSENKYTKDVDETLYYQHSYKLESLYSGTKGITLYPVLTSTDKATTKNADGETTNIGTHTISMVAERVLEDNSTVKMYVSGSSLLYEMDSYMYNEDVCQSVILGILPKESYADIPSKEINNAQLLITQTNFIFIIIVITILAVLLITFGIVVWSKRRKL